MGPSATSDPEAVPWPKVLLGLGFGVVFLVLGFIAGTSDHPPAVAVIASFAPMFVVAATAGWHLPRPWRWAALTGLALTAGTGLWLIQALTAHVTLVYLIQHVGSMALLAFTFGSTVWGPPEDALCSRVARQVLVGEADAAYSRYTWQVTVAWTLFFIIVGAVGLTLYLAHAMAAWATWTMLATPILVGVMFVGEYLVRVRLLPNRPHISVMQTIRAYQRHGGRGTDDGGGHAKP